MRNAFVGFISRLESAKERIAEPEDITIENSKTEKQREKRLEKKKKNRTAYPRTMGRLQKVENTFNGNTRRIKKESDRSNI